MVLVPRTVWQEVERHQPTALRHRTVPYRLVESVPAASSPWQAVFDSLELDAGEREALSLLSDYPDAELLTDDADARAAAEHLGHAVRGTVGVILQAWYQGRKSRRQAMNLLQGIPRRSTLHVRRELLESAITQVRESARE